ncbi:MAG: TIGR01841 family phasin, partial [Rhizobiales bacterium]|nr:TIGR01841 family phasin [Hyphomicrobiales bacterium]
MAKEQQSFIDMFARLGHDLKLPSMDIERVIEHHRKNLEALEKSARAASAGASAVMTRQREMLQQTLDEISGTVRNYRAPASAQELVEKQTEFARKSFETAVKNTGEVADLMRKSGSESLDILRQHDPPQARPQVLAARRQRQDRHHLGGGGDVEAALAQRAVRLPAEALHDLAQRPVVHVEHTPPGDRVRGDAERV